MQSITLALLVLETCIRPLFAAMIGQLEYVQNNSAKNLTNLLLLCDNYTFPNTLLTEK